MLWPACSSWLAVGYNAVVAHPVLASVVVQLLLLQQQLIMS